MTHPTPEEWSSYLDRELPASELSRLEEHARECDGCSQILESLEDLVTTAASLPSQDPARDLWPGVEAKITRQKPLPFSLGTARWLAIAATLALLVTGVSLVVKHRSSTPQQVDRGQPTQVSLEPTSDQVWEEAILQLRNEYERSVGDEGSSIHAVILSEADVLRSAAADLRAEKARDPSNAWVDEALLETLEQEWTLLDKWVSTIPEDRS